MMLSRKILIGKLYDYGQEFFKMQKQASPLSCFKSRERSKGDSITFGLIQSWKYKRSGDILYLRSEKYQNDYSWWSRQKGLLGNYKL